LSHSPLRHPLHPGLQPPTRLCHSSIRNSACESPRVYLFSNLMPPCEIKRDRYNEKKEPVTQNANYQFSHSTNKKGSCRLVGFPLVILRDEHFTLVFQ
jgi:hypothetical protein